MSNGTDHTIILVYYCLKNTELSWHGKTLGTMKFSHSWFEYNFDIYLTLPYIKKEKKLG
jgi:hypothetical protein